MANNENKQQIDDNVQDATLAADEKAVTQSHKPVWIALIILFLLMLAGGGWLYQQITRDQQQQAERFSSFNDALTTVQSASSEQQRELIALNEQLQAQSDKLDEFISRETLTSEELKRTWALQEIEYLLNVANQRALLAHDVDGAIRALEMADKQIQAMSDYRLHPLRALIAEEVMDLEALADIDAAGIAIKLQTAANHVQTLRVKKGPEVEFDESQSMPSATESDAGWKQALDDIWQQMRSLVVIRHDQTGEAAVLVPEQRYFLYQNLRLQLESARLALLNADNDNYQHSLQTAIDWLQQYFTGEQRDALLNTLKKLQDAQINISIPTISGSLNWLEEYQQ
ncbi:uroporphyrinogen-III C-methyltransferase [Methylophaga sp. OBS1]|uniref:uroporphyrinogen-III C-methyltransferase n=1 Tax=Methylophaga sp. OBS1 TaxID=2991933 RepID=UPI002255DDDA|nr:uroporphyrinogen-III C-methyltransferase [Methylophaga sp. OBS1]MCX4192562.1 uroporphyrinogen-III C-methyltransferase [Methylophaga sp. OBS1]